MLGYIFLISVCILSVFIASMIVEAGTPKFHVFLLSLFVLLCINSILGVFIP